MKNKYISYFCQHKLISTWFIVDLFQRKNVDMNHKLEITEFCLTNKMISNTEHKWNIYDAKNS